MPDRPPPRARVAASAALLMAVAGCGPFDGGGEASGGADPVTVNVFAAASLQEAFEELAERFDAAYAGVEVELSFAGSSELAQQINQGAPADVFASADPATMDLVVAEGNTAAEPEVFARNVLEIAVPPGNPAGVGELADLADPEVTVALCAEEVPCGAAAQRALTEAGVEVEPVTWERDVRAALTRVRLGEVDAALVYRTDVLSAADEVEGLGFPEADVAPNDYLVAPLTTATEPEWAAEFTALVLSEEGAEVLAQAGFR